MAAGSKLRFRIQKCDKQGLFGTILRSRLDEAGRSGMVFSGTNAIFLGTRCVTVFLLSFISFYGCLVLVIAFFQGEGDIVVGKNLREIL